MNRDLEVNKIHNMNCMDGLKLLADNSIDCCVTSPPYYGLRDYGTGKWEGGDWYFFARGQSRNCG